VFSNKLVCNLQTRTSARICPWNQCFSVLFYVWIRTGKVNNIHSKMKIKFCYSVVECPGLHTDRWKFIKIVYVQSCTGKIYHQQQQFRKGALHECLCTQWNKFQLNACIVPSIVLLSIQADDLGIWEFTSCFF
jgi:hypothetical protein